MGGDRHAKARECAFSAGSLMARIYGFPPVADANSRVLILGSMPSVKSLEDGFYYGHPRNAFWHVLADVFEEPLPADIPAKKRLLLRHGLALWDVIASCERDGSLDSAIRRDALNDFHAFFADHPGVRAVLVNGGLAAQKFKPALAEGRPILRLPSTSPAYTLSYDKKRAAWRSALMQILEDSKCL